jgi:hypothetical protein
LTVLLHNAQCKMNYWWLVTWLDYKVTYNYLFLNTTVAARMQREPSR